MRALTIVRTLLTNDVPEIFSGTVEVDENVSIKKEDFSRAEK
jgi:hypothetical protein